MFNLRVCQTRDQGHQGYQRQTHWNAAAIFVLFYIYSNFSSLPYFSFVLVSFLLLFSSFFFYFKQFSFFLTYSYIEICDFDFVFDVSLNQFFKPYLFIHRISDHSSDSENFKEQSRLITFLKTILITAILGQVIFKMHLKCLLWVVCVYWYDYTIMIPRSKGKKYWLYDE